VYNYSDVFAFYQYKKQKIRSFPLLGSSTGDFGETTLRSLAHNHHKTCSKNVLTGNFLIQNLAAEKLPIF
jgi:hypothetical protein